MTQDEFSFYLATELARLQKRRRAVERRYVGVRRERALALVDMRITQTLRIVRAISGRASMR